MTKRQNGLSADARLHQLAAAMGAPCEHDAMLERLGELQRAQQDADAVATKAFGAAEKREAALRKDLDTALMDRREAASKLQRVGNNVTRAAGIIRDLMATMPPDLRAIASDYPDGVGPMHPEHRLASAAIVAGEKFIAGLIRAGIEAATELDDIPF